MDTNHDCCAGGVPLPIDWSFRRAVQDAHNRRMNALLDNLRMTRDVHYRYLQRITAEEPMETETKPFDWAVAQQHPAYVFTKYGDPVTHLVAVGEVHVAGYIPGYPWPQTWERFTGRFCVGGGTRDLVLRAPKPAPESPPHEVFLNIYENLIFGYHEREQAARFGAPFAGVALAERYVRAADCELPSHHKIGDRVSVLDMFPVGPVGKRAGEITAVTFRTGKVTYDIQLDIGGEELRNVDSVFVSP